MRELGLYQEQISNSKYRGNNLVQSSSPVVISSLLLRPLPTAFLSRSELTIIFI
jgi:hypothetical protein